MAHKVNARAFRLATVHGSDAKWFGRKDTLKKFLEEDVKLRGFLLKKLKEAQVDHIDFERTNQNVTIIVHSAKPGVIIGRAGVGIEDLKKQLLGEFYRGRRVTMNINVQEVSRPSLSATIVGQQIATDLEKRMPFRRVMKMAIERVMKAGAQGVRVKVGGRLNGAEIARDETLSSGKIPLQTLRADIDFSRTTAYTIFGTIGVKVWIYRGEIFEEKKKEQTD
ncbi:MAG: 30S ribosomal protein S3 [Patescibacteria group bacterium]